VTVPARWRGHDCRVPTTVAGLRVPLVLAVLALSILAGSASAHFQIYLYTQ
jgi:hypothetical protein